MTRKLTALSFLLLISLDALAQTNKPVGTYPLATNPAAPSVFHFIGAAGTGGSAPLRLLSWDTVRHSLQGVINVKSFGATGNGTTDDHSAIQAAMDYATQDSPVTETSIGGATNRTRGAVYFPAGTYRMSAPLMVSNENPRIVGDAWFRSVLKFDAGVSGIVTTNAPRYGTIEDIAIVTPTVAPTPGNVGLHIDGTQTNGFSIPTPYAGFWRVRNVFVAGFDRGFVGNALQDSVFDMNTYHCNTGVVLTNRIHGVEFTGSVRFNRTNHFVLGDLRRCVINAFDCDLSDNDTATNVFRVIGPVQYTTFRGRSEIHKPNVRVFNFESGNITRTTLDNYEIGHFDDAEGWSLYFGDNYTNSFSANIAVIGGEMGVTNYSFGGAKVRSPSGTRVKLIEHNTASLLIAGFTNGVRD